MGRVRLTAFLFSTGVSIYILGRFGGRGVGGLRVWKGRRVSRCSDLGINEN